jgi:general secretion pathway protein F
VALYAYTALDGQGKTIGGIVDAESQRSARQKLRAGGIFPIKLAEERRAAAPAGRTRALGLTLPGDRVPAGELAAMTRQFSTLIGAGLPLVEALGALAARAPQHLHAALRQHGASR